MKNLAYIISAVMLLSCASCGSNQKPGERVENYGEEVRKDSSSLEGFTMSSEKVYVPFQRADGDLAQVQVSLNGVPFNMWWDTGASVTSISKLEFINLVKAGKIDEKEDHIGYINSSYADGSKGTEPLYRIGEITIQGKDNQTLRLYGVAVSVSENLSAPMLIGQNVISQLPKHKFNDYTGVIEFDKE